MGVAIVVEAERSQIWTLTASILNKSSSTSGAVGCVIGNEKLFNFHSPVSYSEPG